MRNAYDLSHLSHTCGDIGRLQTLTVIPVEAGSSLELNMDGIARLAPTRKEIVSECQVDICAFYVPHRHIFGQDWVDFIKSGAANGDTPAFTGISVPAGARKPLYLGMNNCGATINRTLVSGYNKIWYNYYSIPSFPNNADNALPNTAFDWFPDFVTDDTDEPDYRTRLYGRLCARLPHVLNGGNMVDASGATGWETQDLTMDDREVPIDVANSVFDITDLAKIQSRYSSISENAWFTHFYQDVMDKKWGTTVNKDTDQSNLRPVMLMRETRMMSGTDIDGTDDAALGTFQGKTMERLGMHMPRKFFEEHGNIWVLALFRFPLVHTQEQHYLLGKTSWTYDEIAGDAELVANNAPIPWTPQPWLSSASAWSNSNTIQQPYGQWYRFQNNRIHENYQTIPGYPFSQWGGAGLNDWYYHLNNEYRSTFNTTQIGQWQLHARFGVTKFSKIPGINSSIFAGT